MSTSKSLQVDQIQYKILSFENKTGVKYCLIQVLSTVLYIPLKNLY